MNIMHVGASSWPRALVPEISRNVLLAATHANAKSVFLCVLIFCTDLYSCLSPMILKQCSPTDSAVVAT